MKGVTETRGYRFRVVFDQAEHVFGYESGGRCCRRTPTAGVSCMAWTIFGLSHGSTVAYALLSLGDWRMAAIFAANALCCVAIVVLIRLKRSGRFGTFSAS